MAIACHRCGTSCVREDPSSKEASKAAGAFLRPSKARTGLTILPALGLRAGTEVPVVQPQTSAKRGDQTMWFSSELELTPASAPGLLSRRSAGEARSVG